MMNSIQAREQARQWMLRQSPKDVAKLIRQLESCDTDEKFRALLKQKDGVVSLKSILMMTLVELWDEVGFAPSVLQNMKA